MFAEVAVNKKNNELNRLFTYTVPDDMIPSLNKGSLIKVPFGREKLLGVVVNITSTTNTEKLKSISEIVASKLLTPELLELGKFISHRYLASLPAVLFSMAIFGLRIKKPEKLKHLPIKITQKEHWPELVAAQRQVVKEVTEQASGQYLLHGVTGSGKTEVYLQLFREAFKEGKQALLLVPEISLTPQLTNIFAERFGSDIQVLHSKLSAGERMLVWQKVMSGEIKGIIGARSAIFAPFVDLGVIIMDEEHEYSFKQENIPRFHTRVLAAWRARYHNARLIYGSATPALESYYAALSKKLTLLNMPTRIAEKPMPVVEIIDLKEEIKRGNRSIFSESLQQKIAERLKKGEQTILFLNRRGYSAFMGCRDCGEVMYCPECAVTLTYHQGLKALRCHYCEHTMQLPATCSHCGSSNFRKFGIGTERLEEEIKTLFPQARTIRMDVDTTTRKQAHAEIYSALKKGEIDVLIGTQMVTKGLDLPNVTLVGVVDADISLFMPDFRAREKTFQMLTQVAGRAGRGNIPGEVIFQTFHPEDFTLQAAAKQDYRIFCENELYKRKILNYPPYTSMVRLVIVGEIEHIVDEAACFLTNLIKEELPVEAQVLGPAPAPISKLRGKFRWHVHIKHKKLSEILLGIKKGAEQTMHKYKKQDIVVHIDVDPYSAL